MATLPFTNLHSGDGVQKEQYRQLLETLETETERAHGAANGALSILAAAKKELQSVIGAVDIAVATASSALAVASESKKILQEVAGIAETAQAGASTALAAAAEARKHANFAAKVANWSAVVDDNGNRPSDNADVTTAVTKINPVGWEDLCLDFAVSRSLSIQNNATNPTYQVDIDATSITLVNSTGDVSKVSSVNLTVDITASGADGLDTSTEANSTWYHLWVIYNGSTTAGLLSTSATAPTMPGGYTYKGYVGAIYNTSGGDFIILRQVGYYATGTIITDVSAGSAGSWTSFTIRVPTTAKSWFGNARVAATTGGICYISPGSTGYGYRSIGSATTAVPINGSADIPIFTAQTLWYQVVGTGVTASIDTIGWSF